MSICGPQNLFALFVIFMIGVTVGIATGPSEANKNYCGSGLADVLRLLCKGKYQSRETPSSGDAEPTRDGHQQEQTITQECCRSSGGCSLPTLAKYCAKKPDIQDMFRAFSQSSSSESSQKSRSSAPSTPTGHLNPAKLESSSVPVRTGIGRLGEIMKDFKPLDLSYLLDTRLDGYEAMPSRQRRR